MACMSRDICFFYGQIAVHADNFWLEGLMYRNSEEFIYMARTFKSQCQAEMESFHLKAVEFKVDFFTLYRDKILVDFYFSVRNVYKLEGRQITYALGNSLFHEQFMGPFKVDGVYTYFEVMPLTRAKRFFDLLDEEPRPGTVKESRADWRDLLPKLLDGQKNVFLWAAILVTGIIIILASLVMSCIIILNRDKPKKHPAGRPGCEFEMAEKLMKGVLISNLSLQHQKQRDQQLREARSLESVKSPFMARDSDRVHQSIMEEMTRNSRQRRLRRNRLSNPESVLKEFQEEADDQEFLQHCNNDIDKCQQERITFL